MDPPERVDHPQWEVSPRSPGRKLPFAHPLEQKAPCACPSPDRDNIESRAACSADPRSSKRTVAPASEAQRPAKKKAPAQAAADAEAAAPVSEDGLVAEAAPAAEAEPVAEAEQAAGAEAAFENGVGPSEPEAASPLLARCLTCPDFSSICLIKPYTGDVASFANAL